MKFRVGRETLGEAVAFVSRALPSRPVVPLLSGMLLQAGPDGLTLSCFDYEVSARIRVDADVAEPGTVLVPGRLLAEITRSLPDRPAEFADDADLVSLTCGRAEFGLVCLPIQDYPPLPESPPSLGEVDAGLLAAATAQVASSASRDDTLPMLTAVCLDIDGPVMTLAATDRYRLAARQVRFAPVAPALRAVALVPARVMAETARALPPGAPVSIAFGAGAMGAEADHGRGAKDRGAEDRAAGDEVAEGRAAAGRTAAARAAGAASEQPRPAEGLISFQSGDRRITTRLIAGEFIRYQSRFPDSFGSRAEFLPGPVIEAVRRAALVAERAGPVRLSFGDGRVVIEAHAEGRARAAESVPAEFAGDSPVISFNPHYLLDGLVAAAAVGAEQQTPSDQAAGDQASSAGQSADVDESGDGELPPGQRIRLEFNTPAKPALLTWAGPVNSTDAAGGDAAGRDEVAGGHHAAGGGEAGGGDETAGGDETVGNDNGAGAVDSANRQGGAGPGAGIGPEFRYLLVPLRVPARA